MQYGTIVEFFPSKGYGFIRPDFGPDVFFHMTAFGACQERLEIVTGQMVKYELASATEVLPAEPDQSATKRRPAESSRPQASMVELVDSLPPESVSTTRKPQVVRH